jgi:hypothetical protein
MRFFLPIIFLVVPVVSFGATDENEPCGFGLTWIPFFKTTTANVTFKIGDQNVEYLVVDYSSEEEAKTARTRYRVVKQFASNGLLRPFRLFEFRARVRETIYGEPVRGRTVQELKDDRSLDPTLVKQVLERFQASLQSVRKYASENRLQHWEISASEPLGYGIGVELDAENKFAILSSNVVVDAQTGAFVLIALNGTGEP